MFVISYLIRHGIPNATFETFNPVFPIWRYLRPAVIVVFNCDAPPMMLHSLLNLLRWVLLPESKSMSSMASIDAIGARSLGEKKGLRSLKTDVYILFMLSNNTY